MKMKWIDLNRMFSTVGIIGIWETCEILKQKYNLEKNIDLEKLILQKINHKVDNLQQSDDYKNFNDNGYQGIYFNIEQIPGETMASRFANSDKLIFGENIQTYKIYSNQYIPLSEDISIYTRMKKDGEYNSLITGGGIVHINLFENLTKKQKYYIKCHF
jgi:ribonucleoside-triphosphate reductase